MFETDPEQFQPTHAAFLRLVHPEDRARVDDAFARSRAQCASGAIEHRLLMPDGRIKFIEERWQVVPDEQGRPGRATGTCQDISSRQRAQEAIRMQAHMLDQIGQAVIATDTAGVVTYVNRCAGDLYGWAPADMLGRLITDVTVPQATRDQAIEIMAHLQRGETWTGEFLVQNRHGRIFPAQVTDSPVVDASGRVTGIVGISTDITARKQAEAEARRKDTLIRIAGRLTRTGGWALELPGDRVSWSDELFDILDYPRGSTPTFAEGLPQYLDPWRDTIVPAVQTCRQEGTPCDLELEIVTGKGVRKWVRVSAEAERHADGSITRVQGAVQDITEHKHLEQQYLRAQRMESIGTLAGGIAHDLNNVLAPILLSIGLLEQDEHNPERLETLATIEASAKRGAAMVARVLSFARGVDGQREQVQVPLLVRDVATLVRDTFPKNITFTDHVSPDVWPLLADDTQLHQVLVNLCVNARDAMPSGGHITLTAKNIVIDEAFAAVNIDARSGPHVTIAVEDTGTGIPMEIIGKIFDPFFTTKEIGKGTGLGLATSLAIVTGHKGFMRVFSGRGTPTRFELYLPALTTLARRVAPVAAAVLPAGHGETILVVDDEPAIRRIAQRTLEAFGYRVLLAADGADAVALYERHRAEIDVVLTDMMMPRMDGTATIQELVRLDPQVRIVSASGLVADATAAGAAGARVLYFLHKPYTAETLLTAVRAALLE
ncbi:MAG TPA: PAS domain S-box protein [Vicinamibacterales bacterium]|nr:PAS domain S-box protein [Vicinamibacterales bacterium]